MAKIMLVEDDKNLSSIYRDRLLAEGYDIVEAHDGEEALALAVKERPDLIVSDVMMPKISGFDMLDILRSTPETRNTKVIMMTALSQSEDQQRATQLGADKYLVKSQVTLDDVARVVREVLAGGAATASNSPTESSSTPQQDNLSSAEPALTTQPLQSQMPSETVLQTPQDPSAQEIATTVPVMSGDIPAETTAEEKSEIEKEIIDAGANMPSTAPLEVTPSNPQNSSTLNNDVSSDQPNTLVSPENLPAKPDIMELYAEEMSKTQDGTVPQDEPKEDQGPAIDPHNIAL